MPETTELNERPAVRPADVDLGEGYFLRYEPGAVVLFHRRGGVRIPLPRWREALFVIEARAAEAGEPLVQNVPVGDGAGSESDPDADLDTTEDDGEDAGDLPDESG